MQPLVPVFAFIFAFTAAGFLLRKLGLLTPSRVRGLSWTALNVSLPALTIASLHRAPPLQASLLMLPAASWLSLLMSTVIGYVLLIKVLKLPARMAGSLFLPAVLGNVTFVGYPALSALLGDDGLLRAIFFDQLANGIFLATAGVAIAQWAGDGSRMPVRMLVKGVLSFPPLWGLIVGFALRGMPLPEALTALLGGIGATTTPFFLLGLGATLSLVGWRESLPGALAVSTFKLLLMPAAGYAMYRFLPMAPLDLQVATLQTAMPCALACVSMAITYGLETRLVVNSVALCLILSALTLPFWVWVLSVG